MKNGIKSAQLAKQNKTLDILVRYEEGVMTRRQWLKMQLVKGASVNEGTKNRIQYNRIKFNRMSSNNEQEEYMKNVMKKLPAMNCGCRGNLLFGKSPKLNTRRF